MNIFITYVVARNIDEIKIILKKKPQVTAGGVHITLGVPVYQDPK